MAKFLEIPVSGARSCHECSLSHNSNRFLVKRDPFEGHYVDEKRKSVDELDAVRKPNRAELTRVNCLTRGSVGEICTELGAATRELPSLKFPGEPSRSFESSWHAWRTFPTASHADRSCPNSRIPPNTFSHFLRSAIFPFVRESISKIQLSNLASKISFQPEIL